MSEQFHSEDFRVELPNPHPFELSEEKRREHYREIAESFRKNEKNFVEFSDLYFAIMDYCESLEDSLDWTEYAKNIEPLKNSVIETAKLFTDCAVAIQLDPKKADDDTWQEDRKFWHTEFEKAIDSLIEIKNRLQKRSTFEIETAFEKLSTRKERSFTDQLALMVACRQTILPDDREKIRVEK